MTPENKNITFDESKFKIRSRAILGEPEVPTMIRVLVRNKIVKNENQAVTILLSGVVLLIGASVFLINKSVSVPTATISPTLMTNNY